MARWPARGVVIHFVLVLTVACASAAPQRRATASEQRLITTDELAAVRYANAFEIVQALRPQWLRPRGRTSITQRESVKVYLDDSLLGEPEQLRQISTRSIATIRYLDANEATQRWGLDHGHGAIVVSTRRD